MLVNKRKKEDENMSKQVKKFEYVANVSKEVGKCNSVIRKRIAIAKDTCENLSRTRRNWKILLRTTTTKMRSTAT